jgi:hypothetical protein
MYKFPICFFSSFYVCLFYNVFEMLPKYICFPFLLLSYQHDHWSLGCNNLKNKDVFNLKTFTSNLTITIETYVKCLNSIYKFEKSSWWISLKLYCSCEDDWKPNNQNLVTFNSFENSNLEIGEHSFKNCYSCVELW